MANLRRLYKRITLSLIDIIINTRHHFLFRFSSLSLKFEYLKFKWISKEGSSTTFQILIILYMTGWEGIKELQSQIQTFRAPRRVFKELLPGLILAGPHPFFCGKGFRYRAYHFSLHSVDLTQEPVDIFSSMGNSLIFKSVQIKTILIIVGTCSMINPNHCQFGARKVHFHQVSGKISTSAKIFQFPILIYLWKLR